MRGVEDVSTSALNSHDASYIITTAPLTDKVLQWPCVSAHLAAGQEVSRIPQNFANTSSSWKSQEGILS